MLAFVFVSVAISFSAGFRSPSLALYGVIGLFVLFYIWSRIPTLIRYVLNGFALPTTPPPEWAQFVGLLNPQTAYQYAIATLIPNFRMLGTLTQASGSDPFYLQNWFGFVVLLAWVVVPLTIGYLRFERTDL